MSKYYENMLKDILQNELNYSNKKYQEQTMQEIQRILEDGNYIDNYNSSLTERDINCAFANVFMYLLEAVNFAPYKESKQQFDNVLQKVKKWYKSYCTFESLSFIDADELNNVDDILYELDGKYLTEDGLSAEMLYEWFIQLCVLIEKSKERRK